MSGNDKMKSGKSEVEKREEGGKMEMKEIPVVPPAFSESSLDSVLKGPLLNSLLSETVDEAVEKSEGEKEEEEKGEMSDAELVAFLDQVNLKAMAMINRPGMMSIMDELFGDNTKREERRASGEEVSDDDYDCSDYAEMLDPWGYGRAVEKAPGADGESEKKPKAEQTETPSHEVPSNFSSLLDSAMGSLSFNSLLSEKVDGDEKKTGKSEGENGEEGDKDEIPVVPAASSSRLGSVFKGLTLGSLLSETFKMSKEGLEGMQLREGEEEDLSAWDFEDLYAEYPVSLDAGKSDEHPNDDDEEPTKAMQDLKIGKK